MPKQRKSDAATAQNGHEEEIERYERELAAYLQERIKPGLNSGAIPLVARSIAKEIAHRERPNGGFEEPEGEDEPAAEADDEPTDEGADEPTAEEDDEPTADEDDEAPADEDDEPTAEEDDEPSAEEDDEPSAESGEPVDFEADMRELQAELGEDWILRFSVQGDDAWLTAEKDDGSQRLEAPTAQVLSQAVGLLNEGGGRSGG